MGRVGSDIWLLESGRVGSISDGLGRVRKIGPVTNSDISVTAINADIS